MLSREQEGCKYKTDIDGILAKFWHRSDNKNNNIESTQRLQQTAKNVHDNNNETEIALRR